jgi:hypothetical protein
MFTINRRKHANTPKLPKREAEQLGLKVYWSGKPCPKGHIDFRYISMRGRCCACVREDAGKRRQKERFGSSAFADAEARKKAEALREQIELEKELRDY